MLQEQLERGQFISAHGQWPCRLRLVHQQWLCGAEAREGCGRILGTPGALAASGMGRPNRIYPKDNKNHSHYIENFADWWFGIFFSKSSQLTNIYQMGWNHQPDKNHSHSKVLGCLGWYAGVWHFRVVIWSAEGPSSENCETLQSLTSRWTWRTASTHDVPNQWFYICYASIFPSIDIPSLRRL